MADFWAKLASRLVKHTRSEHILFLVVICGQGAPMQVAMAEQG